MTRKIVFAIVTALFALGGATAAQKVAAPPPPASEATRAVVQSYLEIQAALAADRFDDVKGPARNLASQAAALGKDGAELAKASTAFAAAANLEAARTAFGPLSDAVIARVKADGSADLAAGLKVGFCPMARKSWLQREEQVRNPYYGARMLTCGELKPAK